MYIIKLILYYWYKIFPKKPEPKIEIQKEESKTNQVPISTHGSYPPYPNFQDLAISSSSTPSRAYPDESSPIVFIKKDKQNVKKILAEKRTNRIKKS